MSSVTTDRYSHTARVLHWLSAAVILWATVTGLYAAVWAGPELKALISFLNVSVTTLLIPVFALRIGYRLVSRQPGPLAVTLSEQRAARVGHFLLYALTTLVLATGVAMMEHDIQVFDWLSIARPVTDPDVNRCFAVAHRATSGLLGLMLLLHVAAVVRHQRRGVRVLRRMLWRFPRRSGSRRSAAAQSNAGEASFRDAGGHAVFAHGSIGTVHVLAHMMLDQGRPADGHRLLGAWLEGRSGSGSEWIHLHFHMAVFELALGDWDAAHARFMNHILPSAATTEDALTDAPALLWRLQLSAPRPVALPWQPLRRIALKRMQRVCDPFVQLHNLLALAGAGDFESIDRWLQTQPLCDDASRECVLRKTAIALKAFAARTYRNAAAALESVLPHLPGLGGSLAQHRLFIEMVQSSWRLVRQVAPAQVESNAA